MGKCKCVYCGADFSGNFEYCPYCGEKILNEGSDAVAEQQSVQTDLDKSRAEAQPENKDINFEGIDIEEMLMDNNETDETIQDSDEFDSARNFDEIEAISEIWKADTQQTVDFDTDNPKQSNSKEIWEQEQYDNDNDDNNNDNNNNDNDNDNDNNNSSQYLCCSALNVQKILYEKPLTNELKVFLTAVTVLFPGVGQILGVICSIIFMNSNNDLDRRSFGKALLITSLLMFVLVCISCFTVTVMLTAIKNSFAVK